VLDKYDCYELCVQSARHVDAFLRGVHGGRPVALREDFCGTGAVARRWCLEPGSRAVCVDLDPDALARLRRDGAGVLDRIDARREDAITAPVRKDDACDAIFVGNFSIGYIRERAALIEYLRRSCERLAMGGAGFGGGVFACDTYGGAGAFRLGGFTRRHPGRGREVIDYTWVHEEADPREASVVNSISFRVLSDGEVVQELPRAFEYRWRLWSIAELREAMLEAGFASVEVYKDINVAPGHAPRPVGAAAELGEDWIVMVVAREGIRGS